MSDAACSKQMDAATLSLFLPNEKITYATREFEAPIKH